MNQMNINDLLKEMAARPLEITQRVFADCTAEELNAHPAQHPNSIAWLLWHTGREIDFQLADLGGNEVWKAQKFNERFGLGELGDSLGYGHSEQEAHSIQVSDPALLIDYITACTTSLQNYVETLSEADLDQVIDERWNPPVTRGVRLVSMVDDALQHVGQASYALGQIRA